MIEGVASVWVPVDDMGRAIGFYRDTLGLDVTDHDVTDHDGDWGEVQANKLRIGLNAREGDGAGAGGGPVIAFEPANGIEEAVEELRSKGVDFPGEISDHSWGRVATFRDSEGNDLQLYVPPND